MKAKNVFYNATFNYESELGVQKFVWGITEFDLSKPLKDQILSNGGNWDLSKVYNFQINAFNNIDTEN